MARAEGQVAFNAIFDRLDGLRLAGRDAVVWRADNLQFRGLKRLAVNFDAKA